MDLKCKCGQSLKFNSQTDIFTHLYPPYRQERESERSRHNYNNYNAVLALSIHEIVFFMGFGDHNFEKKYDIRGYHSHARRVHVTSYMQLY